MIATGREKWKEKCTATVVLANSKFFGYSFNKSFSISPQELRGKLKTLTLKTFVNICISTHLSRSYDVHRAEWKCPENQSNCHLVLSFIWYLIPLPLSQLTQSSLNSVQLQENNNHGLQKIIIFLGVPWSARESRANGIKSISGKIIFFTLCPITRSGLRILRDAQHYHSFHHSNIQTLALYSHLM